MFSLASFPRMCRHGIRSLVCLSLCAMLPTPPQPNSPRVVASRQADDSGPGWYDSSWDLVRGLDIAVCLTSRRSWDCGSRPAYRALESRRQGPLLLSVVLQTRV